MNIHDLASLGWTAGLAQAFAALAAPGLIPARVAAQHRGRLVLYAGTGELDAEPSGRLRHLASPADLPAVGDWVAARPAPGLALIEQVLPRRSAFARLGGDLSRRSAVVEREVVAANVDLALVVAAAADLKLRRLERFLAAAWESGAEPAVVLTKADLAADPAGLLRLVRAAAPGVQALALSNLTGEGVDRVRALIGPGRTAALLGPSGVGKSSLVNRLLGRERQAVSAVDGEGKGRHTTTHRELILLEGGGLVLDTPGMRLLTPPDEAGLEAAFSDVEALARGCRFADCSHQAEPGCAVRAAAAAGLIEPARLAALDKLRRELAHLERKDDKAAQARENRRWRSLHKAGRDVGRQKRRGWD